jgi:hypothetical protein
VAEIDAMQKVAHGNVARPGSAGPPDRLRTNQWAVRGRRRKETLTPRCPQSRCFPRRSSWRGPPDVGGKQREWASGHSREERADSPSSPSRELRSRRGNREPHSSNSYRSAYRSVNRRTQPVPAHHRRRAERAVAAQVPQQRVGFAEPTRSVSFHESLGMSISLYVPFHHVNPQIPLFPDIPQKQGSCQSKNTLQYAFQFESRHILASQIACDVCCALESVARAEQILQPPLARPDAGVGPKTRRPT